MSHQDSIPHTASGLRAVPYRKQILLPQGQGFLEDKPAGALNVAKRILAYEPEEIEAWILLFNAASKLQKNKKVSFWTALVERFLPMFRKIRNLKNAVIILAEHPTNIGWWHQLCDIAINTGDRHMEEMVRRIIFECDRENIKSRLELAELLCQKADLLADVGPKRTCLKDALSLVEGACDIKKGDQSLEKRQREILALLEIVGWKKNKDEGKDYTGLVVTDKWPTV